MDNRTKWPKSVMSPPERVLTTELLEGKDQINKNQIGAPYRTVDSPKKTNEWSLT